MERRLELISEMTPAIWLHLVFVLAAALLGAVILLRRKGDARHKVMGRIWVASMLIAAISSFFIFEIRDGFSPIHLLSAYTCFSCVAGVVVIRMRHKIPNAVAWHRNFLQGLYASGILIAGGFTFLPNRLLGRLTFGEVMPILNFAFVAICVAGGIWLLARTPRPKRNR